MANELTVNGEKAVALASQYELGDLIKPLKQDIHLFDTFIAGTSHLKDDTPLKEMKEGDELRLIREENRFDDNAIMILDHKGRKMGYVPEKDNVIFARLMDAGKKLIARINTIHIRGTFIQVSIGIYLVDF